MFAVLLLLFYSLDLVYVPIRRFGGRRATRGLLSARWARCARSTALSFPLFACRVTRTRYAPALSSWRRDRDKKKKNYNKKTINRKLEGGARNQQATRSKVARMSEDRDRLATGGGVGVWALGFPNREDIRIRLITVGLSGRNMTKVWSRKYAWVGSVCECAVRVSELHSAYSWRAAGTL